MSQEEKKQTAPETEAAAEKPETPAQEAPEKEAPQTEEKHEGKHDCKHHHHETAALQAKLEAEEKKNADLKNQLLRTAAEYDNYRKRSQREADQKFNDGVSHAVTQILGILDTLDMAANAACADENYKKGVTMTLDKAAKALETLHITVHSQSLPTKDLLHRATIHFHTANNRHITHPLPYGLQRRSSILDRHTARLPDRAPLQGSARPIPRGC